MDRLTYTRKFVVVALPIIVLLTVVSVVLFRSLDYEIQVIENETAGNEYIGLFETSFEGTPLEESHVRTAYRRSRF